MKEEIEQWELTFLILGGSNFTEYDYIPRGGGSYPINW